MTTPKPKRRWFQYSLLALLVFMLLASISMRWLSVKMKKAREQRAAALAIVPFGGKVIWDESGPEWLRRLLGDNYLAKGCCVIFSNISEPTEHCLVFLDCRQTDAGLEQLKRLNEACPVEQLDFVNSGVTDAGLRHIERLSQLRQLGFTDTRFSDAGLEHVKVLTQLQRLLLSGTQVSDSGLEHLNGLNQLEDLWLENTQITDAGLEHLKGLSHLRGLYLNGTKVTDAGLAHLKDLDLDELYLKGSRVTDEGVKKLKRSLRGCIIEH